MKTLHARNNIFQLSSLRLQRKLNRVDSKTLWYRSHPNEFIFDKFGVVLWGEMQAAGQALADNPRARVSVRAGHGTQKTFGAAHLALWFFYCWRPSKVITTAPTGRQVEKLLWSYIRKAHSVAKAKEPLFPGRMLTVDCKASPDWFMYGFSSDEPTTSEGFHGENILEIFDEAKGVDDGIFEGMEGALSGSNARQLAISTPGTPEGEFFEIQKDPRYKHFVCRCEDMIRWYEDQGIKIPEGCTTQAWVDDMAKKWGKDSNKYKMRVDAEFCEAIPEAIIPLQWVERAMRNQRTKPFVPYTEKIIAGSGRTVKRYGTNIRLGLDIAEFGDDMTDFYVGDDFGDVESITTEKKELTETAGTATRLIKKYNILPENVNIDSTGLGSGVGSMLRQNGIPINCIHFAQKSSDRDEFANIVTEMYWAIRNRLEFDDAFSLLDDNDLKEDLTKRKYVTNSNGAFEIEPKKAFKKRVGRSPDKGDAAALCYYKNTRIARAKGRI